MMNDIRVLAICGGGNAGHALAVAASQHFGGEIRWLAGSEEKAAILREGVFSAAGLQSTGAVVGRAGRVRVVSGDPAQVIPDADMILIAVPAFVHADVLRRIAPHLKAGAAVGALPTRSGFEFEAAAILKGNGAAQTVFGLQTLPWSTRVQQPGKIVNFGAIKGAVLMAALPRGQTVNIASALSEIIGVPLMPTDNFLNLTLGNPGQIIHPGLMYGLFRNWNGRRYTESEVPYFYRDTRDDTGAFIEELSGDVRAVAAKIEAESGGALNLSGVLSIHEWIKLSYPSQTVDKSTVASCFRTGPLQARKAPVSEVEPGRFVPNFAYRYLSEDVPYGLVVTRAIAELCGIGTPAIDSVLRWAGRRLDTRYIAAGKIDRKSTAALPLPQNAGIDTMQALLRHYASVPVITGSIDAAREVAS